MKILLLATLLIAGATVNHDAAAQVSSCDGGTPFDRFACDVPALGLLNTQLRTAESQTAATLPAELQPVFAAAEAQWRKYATDLCLVTPAAQIGDSTTAGEAVHCLGSAIRARIKDLPRFRERQGALTFQRREVFAAGPVMDIPPNGQTVWSVEAAYPAVEGTAPVFAVWNQLVADRFAALLEYDPAFGAAIPVTTDELVDYSVQYATERAIGITWHYWSYGHGAAHGNPADFAMHYRLDQGRAVSPADVFADGSGWETALARLAFEELRRQLPTGLFVNGPADIAATVTQPERWQIGGDGLTVFFNVYEVAAYAEGRQEARLPWSHLTRFLRNGAPPDFATAFPAFLRR